MYHEQFFIYLRGQAPLRDWGACPKGISFMNRQWAKLLRKIVFVYLLSLSCINVKFWSMSHETSKSAISKRSSRKSYLNQTETNLGILLAKRSQATVHSWRFGQNISVIHNWFLAIEYQRRLRCYFYHVNIKMCCSHQRLQFMSIW